MLPPVTVSLLVLLGLIGYRWRWLRRYGRSGVQGTFTRLQGTIEAAGDGEVLSRTRSGELWRRAFGLRLSSGELCSVDPRSPWLRLVGQAVRCGELCTVDGVISMRARPEALYREPSQAPALEALRVAPGAWPELRLLRVAAAAAVLSLLATLVIVVVIPPPRDRARGDLADEGVPFAGPPLPQLDCPPDAQVTQRWPERWCERPGQGRHGPWEMHDLDGSLLALGHYRDNKREGAFVRFGTNGRLLGRSRFHADQEEGCTERWTWEGALESRICYRGGELDGPAAIWIGGRLRERGSNRSGRKHGNWEVWSDEGVLLRRGEYADGRRHGLWRFWNEDGGVAAAGSYRDGEPEGRWRWWHDTGALAGEGRYREGEKTGRWRSFYPGGGRLARIDYRKGEAGEAKRWEEAAE